MRFDRAFARLAGPRVLSALEGWSVGRLDVALADGTARSFGPAGAEPAAAIRIHRDAFFRRFVLQGDLGAGESYMDGDWTAEDLPLFVKLVLLNRRHLPLDTPLTKALNLGNDLLQRLRANTRSGSRRNIRYHYDLSNDFFALFLDETMTYSSALFAHEGQPLAQAQRDKFRGLAEKVRLGPRDHLLEIGCGWGGFAVFAAQQYGCRVTGITISEQQYRLARQRVRDEGLEDRVEIRLQDYRDLTGRFDKIVSIEMFEALGQENWGPFFRKCEDVLAPEGLMALQAISIPDHRFDEYTRHCDWLQKWIFPGSLLASTLGVARALASVGSLGIHHLEDVGIHYALTLRRWRAAFLGNLDRVRALGFDERFIRMWDYYLATCEAAFETRTLGNLQLVLTRDMNASLPGIPHARAQASLAGTAA
ncbi:MAG: cyclopropane-fatty-acyl-phospholipid synthase family protein [Vicinamibacteria bacterium]